MSRMTRLQAELHDIKISTDAFELKRKSRDFFWYSPILKERLDHVRAEGVVVPDNKSELLKILKACFELDIPVTPRGGGTGNYGQAMPLAGGLVVDMTAMNAIISIEKGILICEPGALMGEIEQETRSKSGQELRMHPSTRETATIGGFISGGSGGVGSVRWGMLREPGNILRLQVATMEKEPKLVELTGEEIGLVHHSYGVNGIITEVEIPLAPAQDWVELLLAFDNWGQCAEVGWQIASHEGLWLRQCAAIQAPAPHRYFTRHRKFLEDTDNLLCILAAPNAVEPLLQEAERMGARIAFRSDLASVVDKKGLPHLHHLTWNHTTLRALKIDPEMTYLQLGLPVGKPLQVVREVAETFPDEIVNHLEYVRSGGQLYASQLPMVRFSTSKRLYEIIRKLEAMGCPNYNPHACTFEEGNRCGPDKERLALKRKFDPKGLLNPETMIGWDNPDYKYRLEGDYFCSRPKAGDHT